MRNKQYKYSTKKKLIENFMSKAYFKYMTWYRHIVYCLHGSSSNLSVYKINTSKLARFKYLNSIKRISRPQWCISQFIIFINDKIEHQMTINFSSDPSRRRRPVILNHSASTVRIIPPNKLVSLICTCRSFRVYSGHLTIPVHHITLTIYHHDSCDLNYTNTS